MPLPKPMKYSNQLIFCLIPGGENASDENQDAWKNANALHKKRTLARDVANSRLVGLTGKCGPGQFHDLSSYRGEVTDNTRVYLVGHGTAESSHLGGLDVQQLAGMLETLASGRKIKRLGLIGCNTGMADFQLAPERAQHPLAKELYKAAKDVVDEVCGYTGEIHLVYDIKGYYDTPKPDTVELNHNGRILYVKDGTIRRVVDQQVTAKSNTVPRKMIVDANGARWG